MRKPSQLILLVEDEPDLREVIIYIVEAAGFRVEIASNYADGIILLHSSHPAVLLANVLLPDGDGHNLAEVARGLGVPTLLISGHPEAIAKAEARGIPFLAKPFRSAELARMIRSVIEAGCKTSPALDDRFVRAAPRLLDRAAEETC